MGATFIHLSGSKRGKVETLAEEIIKVGSEKQCHLRFDPQSDPSVAPLHAEIRFENCEYILSDKGQGTFVNNRKVPELILQDGDIIEFGAGGPKVRFRIRPEDRACKPFRDICADCLDRTLVAGGNRLVAFPSFLKTMLWEVYREASWKVRLSVFSVFSLMAGSILGSPLLLYKTYADRLHYEKSLLRLSAEMQSDRLSQKELGSFRVSSGKPQDVVVDIVTGLREPRRRKQKVRGHGSPRVIHRVVRSLRDFTLRAARKNRPRAKISPLSTPLWITLTSPPPSETYFLNSGP